MLPQLLADKAGGLKGETMIKVFGNEYIWKKHCLKLKSN